MGKSFRKNPVVGISGTSNKRDKKNSHKKFRQRERRLLQQGKFDDLPEEDAEVSDRWTFEVEAKDWLDSEKKSRPRLSEEELRKHMRK